MTNTTRIIPHIITHKISNGYSVELKHRPILNTVEAYMINDNNTIGEKIKCSSYYSTVYLPSDLDENIEVMIKYEREAHAAEIRELEMELQILLKEEE